MSIDDFYELIKTTIVVLSFLTIILIFIYLSLEKKSEKLKA
ncbi:MAG: hypothetical protein QXZ53_01965 [Candidatus Bathyarchaeia archaeon]